MNTTMKNSGNKRMMTSNWSLKRIRIKPCGDLDVGSNEKAEENLNSRKEKMKTLGTRIYSSRTNSEGRDYSLGWNENKIYCMLILHQIKLMTSNGFFILLILLEKDWEWIAQILRKSLWTTGRIRKNEWIKMITKEKRILNEPP